MKMDLFIRTYRNDAGWLRYLLRSIQKFCSVYNEIIVACPKSDAGIIRRVVGEYPITGMRLVLVENDMGSGYLEQQYTKMTADLICTGDYIGFVDSDCIFILPNSPDTHFVDGKIRYLITPYECVPTALKWKPITEAALGFPCPFETMRRHPCVYPKEVIAHCRAWIEFMHHRSLHSFILEQGISDFNAMGSFALEREPEKFMFEDTTKHPLPPEILKQRWSYGGISPEIAAENESWLK